MAYHLTLADLPPPTPQPKFKLTLADLPPVHTPSLNDEIIGGINNLGGGIAHGATVPIAAAYNIAGNALAHIPAVDKLKIVQSIAHGLKSVHAFNPPFYNPHSVLGQTGNIGAQLATPIPEADVGNLLPEAVKPAKTLLNRLTTNATTGALYSPQGHRTQGAITGAIGGEILDKLANVPRTVGNLGRTIANKYLKEWASDARNHYVGLRTPEEVGKINPLLGNEPVNIGEVIGHHKLANVIYGVPKFVPTIGRKKLLKQPGFLVGQTDKAANDLMNSLSHGVAASDIPTVLQNILKNRANFHEGISRALYAGRDKLANDAGVKVPLTNFQNAASQMETALGTQWGKTPESNHALNIISQLNPEAQTGVTFSNAHFVNSALKDDARNYEKQGNMYGKKLMSQLSAGLEKDIQTAADSTPGLKEAHAAAQNYFKENVLPYRAKSIKNIIKGDANLDSVNKILNVNKSVPKKVLADIGEIPRQQILFNQAVKGAHPTPEGKLETTPQNLINMYKNLSANQRQRLINPNLNKEFQKLTALNQVSQNARGKIYLPNTGAKNLAPLVRGEEALGAEKVASGLGALKTLLYGAPIAGATALTSGKALKLLSSPEIREAYVKGGLKMLPKKAASKAQEGITKGAILALNKALAAGGNQ